jgi:hypothetical protein
VSAIGRSRLEAPEVDGSIFLKGRGLAKIEPGTVLKTKAAQGLDYDLVAEMA